LNRSSNKLTVLSELLDQVNYVEHTLFYCAPGQIDDVVRLTGPNFNREVIGSYYQPVTSNYLR